MLQLSGLYGAAHPDDCRAGDAGKGANHRILQEGLNNTPSELRDSKSI